MENNNLPIYVGYDASEDIAYRVCEYSIYKHSHLAEVKPLRQDMLRAQEYYTRDVDPLSSTEFTFTRFLVPVLQNYQGWALFCDCDFVWDGDVEEIFKQADPTKAVMVVKHEHTPSANIKMAGQKQHQYPRKNWSSMILWNCGHAANLNLTADVVNRESGAYLHRFQWLKDEEIGSLDTRYNFLVGWNKESKDGKPFAYHWTEGGPWFENYRDCEYKEVWYNYLIEYTKEISVNQDLKSRSPITFVTSLSREYFNYIGNITLPSWKNLPGDVVFVWDDKPVDLGFGTVYNFWKEIAPPNDPWLTEGLGGTKADRFWKKSRTQVWAARKFKGLVVWLDTDISINQHLSKSKAIELLHPRDKVWATLIPGDPLDLETGIVAFNTMHELCQSFVSEYSKGWYNGEIHKLRQPYDNHMIQSLMEKYPCKSFCKDHVQWPLVDESHRTNEFSIHYSSLAEYFTHHIGILNKNDVNVKVKKNKK